MKLKIISPERALLAATTEEAKEEAIMNVIACAVVKAVKSRHRGDMINNPFSCLKYNCSSYRRNMKIIHRNSHKGGTSGLTQVSG